MTAPKDSRPRSLTRREFHLLTSASLGGLMGGALVVAHSGCTPAAAADLHVCRGLNQCRSDKNACAGQGSCATYAAHVCSAKNDCQGQGGCGAAPGENKCRGKGGCAVPLADHAW